MGRVSFTLGMLILLLSTGCVYRRMTIMSDPPGARVFVNNVEVGTTPCNVPTNAFIDFGNYKFTLFKDGFEPLEVLQPVPPKWYEYAGIDFFAEVGPWTVKDLRIFSYQMQPVREKSGDELKQHADEFRQRGSGVVTMPPAVAPVNGTAPPLPGGSGPVSPPPGSTGPASPPPGAVTPSIPVPPQ